MILKHMRNVGIAGRNTCLFFIWPLVFLCVVIFVSRGLWNALGWPGWILWAGFILFVFGFDIVFAVMLFVAFIAGFFAGAWQWSLAVLALPVFGFGSNLFYCFLVRKIIGLRDK